MESDGDDPGIRHDLLTRHCDLIARYFTEQRHHSIGEANDIRSHMQTPSAHVAHATLTYNHYLEVLGRQRKAIRRYEEEAAAPAAPAPGGENPRRDTLRHLQHDATRRVLIAMRWSENEASAAVQAHDAFAPPSSSRPPRTHTPSPSLYPPRAFAAASAPPAALPIAPPLPDTHPPAFAIFRFIVRIFRFIVRISRTTFQIILRISRVTFQIILRIIFRFSWLALLLLVLPVSPLWTYYRNIIWQPTPVPQLLPSIYLKGPSLRPASAETVFLPLGKTYAESVQLYMLKLGWSIDAQYRQIKAVHAALECPLLHVTSSDTHFLDLSSTDILDMPVHPSNSYIPQKDLRCSTLASLQSELHQYRLFLRHNSTGLSTKLHAPQSHFLQAYDMLESIPAWPNPWTPFVASMREATSPALRDPSHLITLTLPWIVQCMLRPIQYLQTASFRLMQTAVPSMLTEWMSDNTYTNTDAYASARHHLRLAYHLTESSFAYMEFAVPEAQRIATRIIQLFDQYPDLAGHDKRGRGGGARGAKGWIVPQEMFLGIARSWWISGDDDDDPSSSPSPSPSPHSPHSQHLPIPSLIPLLSTTLQTLINATTLDISHWEREGALVRGLRQIDALIDEQRRQKYKVQQKRTVRPPSMSQEWQWIVRDLRGRKWI